MNAATTANKPGGLSTPPSASSEPDPTPAEDILCALVDAFT